MLSLLTSFHLQNFFCLALQNAARTFHDLNLTVIDLTFFFRSLSKKGFNFIFIKLSTHDIITFFYLVHDVTTTTFFKFNTVNAEGWTAAILFISNFLNVFSCKWTLDSSSCIFKFCFLNLSSNFEIILSLIHLTLIE